MNSSDSSQVLEPQDDSSKIEVHTGITSVWIDKFISYLRHGYFSDFLDKNIAWLTKAGLSGLYVSAILGIATSIYVPIEYTNVDFGYSLAIGFAWASLCIVAHYTAVKFLPNLDNIIRATPTKLTSSAFLDSFAVISGIGGVISLIGGFYLGFETENSDLIVYGIFGFIFCEYLMSLALNPASLNIEITEKTTAGEEFIGILSFVMKGFLRLIPVLFGSGIILGIIRILGFWATEVEYIAQLITQATAVVSITMSAFLPVTGYLTFLLYYFFIDVLASIIAIPKKLDSLHSNTNLTVGSGLNNTSPDTPDVLANDIQKKELVPKERFDDLISKGKKSLQSGDYTAALELINAAIKINENSGEAYYLRAIIYSKANRKNDAVEAIKKAASLGNEKAIKYLNQKNN